MNVRIVPVSQEDSYENARNFEDRLYFSDVYSTACTCMKKNGTCSVQVLVMDFWLTDMERATKGVIRLLKPVTVRLILDPRQTQPSQDVWDSARPLTINGNAPSEWTSETTTLQIFESLKTFIVTINSTSQPTSSVSQDPKSAVRKTCVPSSGRF